MAEHDLPPIVLCSDQASSKTTPANQAINIDRLRDTIPELPSQTRERLHRDYGTR